MTLPSGTFGARLFALFFAVGLAVLCLRQTIAQAAAVSPRLAAIVAPENSFGLALALDRLTLAEPTPRTLARIDGLARKALLRSPVEVGAIRSLAIVAALRDQPALASTYIALAAQTSKRDAGTQAWLLRQHLAEGRIPDAVRAADLLLRSDQASWPLVLPQLVPLIRDPRADAALIDALRSIPPWRGPFLQLAGKTYPAEAEPYALFRRLKRAGTPPSAGETITYFTTPAPWPDPGLMLRRWVALVPDGAGAAGLVRDGGFEGLVGPPPFNWKYYDEGVVAARLADHPDGAGHAAELTFDGSRRGGLLNQLLVLAPGRYRLRAEYRADSAVDPAALGWELRCGDAAPFASSSVPVDADAWRGFAFEFEVPPACPSQHLDLAAYPADLMAPVAVWVDNLVVERSQ